MSRDGPEAVETASVELVSAISCSRLDLVSARIRGAPHSRALMDAAKHGEEE